MVSSMSSSPWDLASPVKLKHFSRCQNRPFMRSLYHKKSMCSPTFSLRESNNSEHTVENSPDTPKTVQKQSPLTAREKLRAARVLSKYTETKPAKPAMGSKVLDALRDADKGGRRSGLPEAPTNMFDDRNRGLAKEGWTFQLPGGNDLLVVVFSVVFISTVMFGTTYVVWKAGAIHFNEY